MRPGGDIFSASITYVGGGRLTLQITDSIEGWSRSLTKAAVLGAALVG